MSDQRIIDVLSRMERQQQAAIQAVNTLMNAVLMNTATISKLAEWLKEPPSSEVADLLKALVAKEEAVYEAVVEVPERVVDALETRRT